jgi:hypothetical protein
MNQIPFRKKLIADWDSENSCYHSSQNHLSSSLLPKNLKIRIYRSIILSVVLCGCETWLHTLRVERRLRVFESWVLRRIFGPTRYQVRGGMRKLHNEELNDPYCLPNFVRVITSRWMRWTERVARIGKRKGAYRVWRGNLRERGHLEGREFSFLIGLVRFRVLRIGWGHIFGVSNTRIELFTSNFKGMERRVWPRLLFYKVGCFRSVVCQYYGPKG